MRHARYLSIYLSLGTRDYSSLTVFFVKGYPETSVITP